jgi:hypothetical protein
LFLLDPYREKLERGLGLPFAAQTIQKLGGTMMVKNIFKVVIVNGNKIRMPYTRFEITLPVDMSPDKALLVSPDDSFMVKDKKGVGGIDLNAKNLTIENKGGKIEFNTPVNMEELQNAQGFIPVIINVTPVANVYDLLGLVEPAKKSNQKS